MELKKHTEEAASRVEAVLQRAEEQGQMIESLHTSVSPSESLCRASTHVTLVFIISVFNFFLALYCEIINLLRLLSFIPNIFPGRNVQKVV